jgi:hypothetical protein
MKRADTPLDSDTVLPGLQDAAEDSAGTSAPASNDFLPEGPTAMADLPDTQGLDPMSLATLDIPSNRLTTGTVPGGNPEASQRLRAVPAGTEARGFVLYVGLGESKAAAAGTDLGTIVEALKSLAAQLAPTVETYAAVALAPRDSGGRDVDVVRLALQDPAALAKHRHVEEPQEKPRGGVIVDISRKRLVLDGETAGLTYKEFELLQYLVLREGRTIERAELISSLWGRTARTTTSRTSERSMFTCDVFDRSSAPTKTSCARFAGSGTASITTRMSRFGMPQRRARTSSSEAPW